MKITFKIGKHRGSPLYWLRWWAILFNPKQIVREIMFTSDSKYYLDNEDQEDRNKIIGIRYGFKKTSPSARFTQWYNPESQLWHIDWYCCVNGITSFAMLCVVPVDKDFKLTLLLRGTHYKFEVRNQGGLLIATKSIEKKHKHWLGILLGPYFGGNRTPKQKHSYKLSKP